MLMIKFVFDILVPGLFHTDFPTRSADIALIVISIL